MAIEYGAKNRYRAYGIPSLDLTFADRKSLVDRISGNNLITFTRSTTGTYVGSDGLIKTAAVNEPRFDHNPLTRESLGLLVEEARTNYFFAYASPNYNTSSAAVYSTYSDSRFGAAENAHSWTWPSAAGAIELGWFNPGSVSTTGNDVQYTISFWAKANQAYTMSSGIVDERRQGVTFATSLTTSWQYFGFSTPAGIADDGAGTVYFRWLRDAVNHAIPAGLRIDFAAVNLERGGFPTSYIPTTGSTVTRASDVATIQGSIWLNIWNVGGAGNSILAEGTLAYTTTAPYPGGPVMYAMDGNNGGVFSKQWYSYLEANRGPIDGTGGGGGAAELFHGAVTSRGPGTFKSCMTFDVPNDRLKSSWNTVLSEQSGNAAYFNSMWALGANPGLTIGGKDLGSNRHAWCGCIKRMSIYSVGLPDAQLQALTVT